LTSIAGNRLKRTLDEAINNSEGRSSAMTNESTYDTDETTDESPGSSTFRRRKFSDISNFQDDTSNSSDSGQIEQPPLTYSVLKKRITAKADEIHSMYQKNQKITPGQRKLMSCGSSLILDLIDKSENNAYNKLFSYVYWNKIVLAFENDLLLPEARIQEKLMTK
jgi:hypothetical protein